MAYLIHPAKSYQLTGGTGAAHTGGTGPVAATVTAVLTTVPDSAAVRTSVPTPAAALEGTVRFTVAAPSDTGMVPSAVDAPAESVNTALRDLLTGLPSEVRSSLESCSVMASPPLTSAAVELTTAMERRPKSGATGLCPWRYLIQASRSTSPESSVPEPSLKIRKLSPPVARKLNVLIR